MKLSDSDYFIFPLVVAFFALLIVMVSIGGSILSEKIPQYLLGITAFGFGFISQCLKLIYAKADKVKQWEAALSMIGMALAFIALFARSS